MSPPVTRSQTLKELLLEQERKELLARDLKFANENLEIYTRRQDNMLKNPNVDSISDRWRVNERVLRDWHAYKDGLDEGRTIKEQVEIKKSNEKPKKESCTVSGGRRYKRTIKRRKLTKRRNLKSRKVK